MSTNRVDPRGGWVTDYDSLAKGPSGRNLCRRCGAEVPPGCRTFCSRACVHEWKLRTQPGYLRSCVRARDRGVCATCGVDTAALRAAYEAVRQMRWRVGAKAAVAALSPVEIEAARGLSNKYYASGGGFPEVVRALLLGFNPDRQTWWDCDHVVPVSEGGGECGIDNCRTLCLPCHRRATRELARRRAVLRRNLAGTGEAR